MIDPEKDIGATSMAKHAAAMLDDVTVCVKAGDLRGALLLLKAVTFIVETLEEEK